MIMIIGWPCGDVSGFEVPRQVTIPRSMFAPFSFETMGRLACLSIQSMVLTTVSRALIKLTLLLTFTSRVLINVRTLATVNVSSSGVGVPNLRILGLKLRPWKTRVTLLVVKCLLLSYVGATLAPRSRRPTQPRAPVTRVLYLQLDKQV